jgi:hypothetical protein
VTLRPRWHTTEWITPRRLGAAAVIYGVFASGWYLGHPVTPECDVDQAALDRIAEEYETEPPPAPTPTAYPSPYDSVPPVPTGPTPGSSYNTHGSADYTDFQTVTLYAVACTNDVGERPRIQAWFEDHWR